MWYNRPMESEPMASGLSTRQKLLNDCRQLAAIARQMFEQGVERNEKALSECLSGERREKLLMLMDAFVDHLGEVHDADDLPGPCEEAKDLRAYSLAALGECIARVGDPLSLAETTTGLALAFTDALIERDLTVVQNLRYSWARKLASGGLRSLTLIGGLQLKESDWLRLFLSMRMRRSASDKRAPKVGEWMLREYRGVESLARRSGSSPESCAEAYWEANRRECELARYFPPSLRGYDSAACLKQKFVRTAPQH